MDYKTVFEVTDKGFDYDTLTPLLFIAIGLGVSLFNLKYNKSKSFKRNYAIVFGFIFSGFALIMSFFTIPSYITDRNKTNEMYQNGNFLTVEGKIENFDPMPHSGHAVESFNVNGVHFEYSDFMSVHGFNNTASHGGPLKRNGQQVRLSYISVNGDNRILKIELKE